MTEPKVLWQQLQQAGLVTGELPVLAPNDPQPAFFLRMLLGVSGWLSAVFLWLYFRCFCQLPHRQPKHLGAGYYPLRRQYLDQSSR